MVSFIIIFIFSGKSYYSKSLVERVNHAKVKKEAYDNRPEALTQETPEESSDKINEISTNPGSTSSASNAPGGQLVAFTGTYV